MQKHADRQIAALEVQNCDDGPNQSGVDQLERPSIGDVVRQGKTNHGDHSRDPATADQFTKFLNEEASVNELLEYTCRNG